MTGSHAIQAAIVGAQTWEDLSSLCEDIDAAFRAGDIDTEVADELTNLVRQRAREVPEDDAAFLEMPLDKLAQSGIYREVHSKALDERVIFAADNAEVPEDTPLIVYRAAEMRELLGASPEMLRAAHQVRKAFDGEIVADEDETRIPSSELLDKSRDNNNICAACGQSRWWTKKCGLIFPQKNGHLKRRLWITFARIGLESGSPELSDSFLCCRRSLCIQIGHDARPGNRAIGNDRSTRS